MPLPESGNPISTADINEELGEVAGTLVNIDLVATGSFGLTRPHEFEEFYGLSLDNFATSLSISPTSIVSSSAAGESHTITYTSDGNFLINASSADWITASPVSGSSGSNNTFTLTTDAQNLNDSQRTATVTLESPEFTNQNLSVNQEDNDATLVISRQTGVMNYGHNGGEGEYYKIDTDPESLVTWIASISGESGFSHRIYDSGDSFSSSNISGTGDEFIEVKSDANSTSSDKTATVTVDPQNIDDASVTDTVTTLRFPTLSLAGTGLTFIGGNYLLSAWDYDEYGVSDGRTITVTSNYSFSGATKSGTNADKFTIVNNSSSFTIYPNSYNSSGADYTATITVSVSSNPTLSVTFTATQSSTNPPSVSITPTSGTWAYNETNSSNEITFTAAVTKNGNTLSSVTFSTGNPMTGTDFKLIDVSGNDSLDGGIVVSNSMGGLWQGQNTTNANNYTSFKVKVLPTATNNGSSDLTSTLEISVGSNNGTATDSVNLTQEYQQIPTFAYSDAGVSGFAVSNTGIVTPPSATTGTISSTTYSTGYSSGTYPVVYSSATRTVDVDVTVPSGYTNTGGTVSGTETTTQAVAPRTLDISMFTGGTTIAGNTTNIAFNIDDVYYGNQVGDETDWTLEEVSGGTLSNVTISSTSGDGDESPVQVFFDSNTSGNSKSSTFKVAELNNSGNSDSITITQTSYTPNASSTLSISSNDTSFGYDETSVSNYKALTITVNSGTITNAVISMNSQYFQFVDYGTGDGGIDVSNPYGNQWQAQSTTNSSTYKVYIVPQQQNTTTSNYSVDVSAQVVGSNGTAVASTNSPMTITQEFQTTFETDVSSLQFSSNGGTKDVVLSTSHSWTASISGTGYSINVSSGNAGTNTIEVTKTSADIGVSGTLTISASGEADIIVSLTQLSAPLDFYYYPNNSSIGETGITRTINAAANGGTISIGLYVYRGSTADPTSWGLDRTGGSWLGVSTTNSGQNVSASGTTTQNTGASADELYINYDSQTTTSRTGTVQITIDGFSEVTLTISQAGSSGGGGGECLIQGTKITMLNGDIKRIQHIQVGDVLKSLDIDTLPDGETESLSWTSNQLSYTSSQAVVTDVRKHLHGFIYSFNEGLLHSSPDHNHFIKRDDTFMFIPSREVKVGDYLMNESGDFIEISLIEEYHDLDYPTYKLDVEEHDVFFANGILTHNAKGEPQI
jgi:hypothetical protein